MEVLELHLTNPTEGLLDNHEMNAKNGTLDVQSLSTID
jgi:hypothetical protein